MTDNVIIEIVSATKLPESEFWAKAALGQSLQRFRNDRRLQPRICFQNSLGLPEVNNARISSRDPANILAFIHDDVWIDDFFFPDRILEALKAFDVVGVVGNRRRTELQTSWAFIDDQFTVDRKDNFCGAVAQGEKPFGMVQFLGPSPAACLILDGLFMAARKEVLLKSGVRFDPQFDFHFYDLDFCRSAVAAGLTIGTWPIALTHQSGGAFNTPPWNEKKLLYRAKWGTSNCGEVSTTGNNADVVTDALSIHLYHNAYSEKTLSSKEPGYLLLDNTANERPDWYEYWPIRKFLLNTTLDENAVYGFFSPRFKEKTGLTFEDVKRFIRVGDQTADIFIFSPQPDIGALFRNIYLGGESFSPGFLATSQKFLDEIGYCVDLKSLIMDSRSIVFSNYFAARPRFWRAWLEITEKLFAIAENPEHSSLKEMLTAPTAYPGGVQRKVFVMENVASLLMAEKSWKVVACNPFSMAWSQLFSQFRHEAILCDALKIAMNTQDRQEYSSLFDELQEKVLTKAIAQSKKGPTMDQTPAHDLYNDSILAMLPPGLSKVIEVGCMRGSLAKAYLKSNPDCHWVGIDIDPDNARIAKSVCREVHCMDIEDITDRKMDALFPADVWIFGDTLEHLKDPWHILRRIRERLSTTGAVVASIPNAQNWNFQSRLNVGLLRYENEGLLDRTHLRFFTRTTIFELFQTTGYRIESAVSITVNAPGTEKYIPHIRAMAEASGFSPDQAEADAMPFQYTVRAVPV